uniref:Uncharacterized protein n=1 Tax=Acrobeloides nanus TaxID=290746 RepID=A0A914D5J3_9BILA
MLILIISSMISLSPELEQEMGDFRTMSDQIDSILVEKRELFGNNLRRARRQSGYYQQVLNTYTAPSLAVEQADNRPPSIKPSDVDIKCGNIDSL